MFDVKRITNIKIYLVNSDDINDREVNAICEIEGFEEKALRTVGSLIKHDLEVKE